MDDDAFAGTCPTCGQSYLQAEIARLRAVIGAATQRLNESGTGEIGLLDTIHATHAILRAHEQDVNK